MWKPLTLLATIALALAVLTPGPQIQRAEAAVAPQQLPAGNMVRSEDTPGLERLSHADVLAYWTEERMAAAQAVPAFIHGPGGSAGPALELLADGPAQVAPGNSMGGASPAGPNNLVVGAAWGGAGTGTPNLAYPFAYTTSYGDVYAPVPYAPYSTFGRLFFTQLGGDYVCSGNSVASGNGNKSLVLTAAHCLHAGNNSPTGWSSNMLFIPNVSNAIQPFGQWADWDAAVTTSYYTSDNMREDFGFMVSDPSSNGCGYLGTCVGAEGLAWNQGVLQEFWAYGYPQDPPYNGGRLVLCSASTANLDFLATGSGSLPMAIGCRMTGGSSGGGWVIQGRIAGIGYINSVVTHFYLDKPGAIYGPYFASSFGSLWNTSRNLAVPLP